MSSEPSSTTRCEEEDDDWIEREIQKKLDALVLRDSDDDDDEEDLVNNPVESDEEINDEGVMPEAIRSYIIQAQSRAEMVQKELLECDDVLEQTMKEVDEDSREEFLYKSKELNEFAFEIGEDAEELRDRVIQELRDGDEEDSQFLAIEGLEPKTLEEPGKRTGLELVPALNAETGALAVILEPVEAFENEARKKVKHLEDCFKEQDEQLRQDFEEDTKNQAKRDRTAEEDRERRRRQNDEEQKKATQERMADQAKMEEEITKKTAEFDEAFKKHEMEIQKFVQNTNREKKELSEQVAKQQHKQNTKEYNAATTIQSVFRSFRVRKPYLSKIRQIRELVKESTMQKRQTEIATQRRQDEQRKRRTKEEKRKKDEEERIKTEELAYRAEIKRQEEERLERVRKQKEKEDQEKAEKERLKEERVRQEQEEAVRMQKEKEAKEMEEKANEILAKIQAENSKGEESGLNIHDNAKGNNEYSVLSVVGGKEKDEYSLLPEGEGKAKKGKEMCESDEASNNYGRDYSVGKHQVRNISSEENSWSENDKIGKELLENAQLSQKLTIVGNAFLKDNNEKEALSDLNIHVTYLDNNEVSNLGPVVSLNESKKSQKGMGDSILPEGDKQYLGGTFLTEGDKLIKHEQKSVTQRRELNDIIPCKMESNYNPLVSGDEGLTDDRKVDRPVHEGEKTVTKGENVYVQKEDVKKIGAIFQENDKRAMPSSSSDINGNDSESARRKTESMQEKLPAVTEVSLRIKDDSSLERDEGNEDSLSSSLLVKNRENYQGNKFHITEGTSQGQMQSGRKVDDEFDHLEKNVGVERAEADEVSDALPQDLEEARLNWMQTCVPLGKLESQSKHSLAQLEKHKRRYLRRSTAVKRLPSITEQQIIEGCPLAKSLQEVTTVQLKDLPGCNLTSLTSCPDLRALTCFSSGILALEGLEECKNIAYIDCKGNTLSSIYCRDLQNLVFLDVSNNSLTSVHGLEGCPSLRLLNLSHNKITRLGGIEYVSSVTNLNVSHNQLISVQGLSGLVHLVTLDLSNNHLSNVSGIESCPLLEHLDVSNNSLSEVPLLCNHAQLRWLNMDNNNFSSLGRLENAWLPSLQDLSVNQNSLSELPVLKFALLLQKLDARNNYITETSSLVGGLRTLHHLKELLIQGNPVTEEGDCRSTIVTNSSSVCHVDGEAITEERKQRPLNSRYENMCHAQIEVKVQIRDKRDAVIKSIGTSDPAYLKNLANIWTKWLQYSLKVTIDHRYMHEYGDLSLPEHQNKLSFDILLLSSEGARDEIQQNSNKDGRKYLSDTQLDEKSIVGAASRGRAATDTNKHRFRDGQSGKQESLRDAAATKIQAVWRGYQLRRDLEHHSELYLAAVTIQATWRGYTVRKRFKRAQEAMKVSFDEEEDEMEFGEEVDLESFDFNEIDLESNWIPSAIPDIPSAHPVLPQPPSTHNKPYPLPSPPEKHYPHPPKHAWRGTNSPLSPLSMVMPRGKPPLPPVTPTSSREEQSVGTPRSHRSKKEEMLSEEWGFKDSVTAELMMKRAKKMGVGGRKKKKGLDPVQRFQMIKKMQDAHPSQSVHQSKRGVQRKDYFKAKEEEIENHTREVHRQQLRTFDWVHSQATSTKDGSPRVTSLRDHHSSSEPNLPRMSPDVLQGGRANIVASPSLDLQSVDSYSVASPFTGRGRRHSFSSPTDDDNHQLPAIKTNSAPTTHTRERMNAQHGGTPSRKTGGSAGSRNTKFNR